MSRIKKEMIDNIDFTNHHDMFSLAEYILDNPISYQQIKNMVFHIMNQIRKDEIIIQKTSKQGKDISSTEYERDYAKYVLGLVDKPNIQDYKFWQDRNK